jgi:riboflavin kinase/FMN adenylyltransferase
VLRARLIVVGSDFHFGYRRHGDVPLLQRMGAELGFEAIGLGLVATPDGESPTADALPYSSTRVRTLLAGGDVVGAASVLGRPHEVQGRLDGGDLVVPARVCLPAPGSYDAELRAGADTRPTVATLVTEEAPASERRIALDNGARSGAAALRFVSPRQATS